MLLQQQHHMCALHTCIITSHPLMPAGAAVPVAFQHAEAASSHATLQPHTKTSRLLQQWQHHFLHIPLAAASCHQRHPVIDILI